VSDTDVDAFQNAVATDQANGVTGVTGKYSRDASRNILRYTRYLRRKGILNDAYRLYGKMFQPV
jgi:hypothetical protein